MISKKTGKVKLNPGLFHIFEDIFVSTQPSSRSTETERLMPCRTHEARLTPSQMADLLTSVLRSKYLQTTRRRSYVDNTFATHDQKCPLFECQCIKHESTNWGHCFYVSYWRQGRHFTRPSEPREGPVICSAKGMPSFLSYFKTLSVGPVLGIEPATSRSAVKRSTD